VLNLLFISDSPKVVLLKKELQPFLKVIIDVVTDFDRGMKDVFEKRPATVCIQDNIGNVSAESVARHIQMLLGSAAPKFILLHSGNTNGGEIKGVFDHLVDLSQQNDMILGNIVIILKKLYGSEWDKVFIPAKPAHVQAVTPEKISQDAQQKTGLLEKSASEGVKANVSTDAFMVEEKVAEKRVTPVILESSEQIQPPSPKTASKNPADPALHKSVSNNITSPSLPSAEAFRVSQDAPHIEGAIPEARHFAFKGNYRYRFLFMRRSYVIALVCIVSVAGGWFLFTQKPQMLDSLTQRFLPSLVAKQAPVTAAPQNPAQKPVQPPLPPPVAAVSLPSFIPQEGVDNAFAQKNPGWKRFVGEKYDFRIFTTPGRIEAVQVLAINSAIPESLIQSVLQEFNGTSKFQILSHTTKDGVRIESGIVQNKGEIIIYRNRKNGAVKAFVVSVN